jgi:hypothetical protein
MGVGGVVSQHANCTIDIRRRKKSTFITGSQGCDTFSRLYQLSYIGTGAGILAYFSPIPTAAITRSGDDNNG